MGNTVRCLASLPFPRPQLGDPVTVQPDHPPRPGMRVPPICSAHSLRTGPSHSLRLQGTTGVPRSPSPLNPGTANSLPWRLCSGVVSAASSSSGPAGKGARPRPTTPPLTPDWRQRPRPGHESLPVHARGGGGAGFPPRAVHELRPFSGEDHSPAGSCRPCGPHQRSPAPHRLGQEAGLPGDHVFPSDEGGRGGVRPLGRLGDTLTG